MAGTIRESTVTCPRCGNRTAVAMPEDACLYYFDCPGCGAVLKPLPGDCCVFCSYGSARCPSVQRQTAPRDSAGRRS